MMLIKKLGIASFGKFKDKEIILKKGLNIIYGVNEAGKSTIHKFIEGMFFGFYKSYVKVRKHTDGYKKYMPWSSSNYSGYLEFEYNGKGYRIERQFKKGNVKVFDLKTGEDITKTLEYNSTIKLYEPASIIQGLTSTVFTGTISIGQMEHMPDKNLAAEVRDRLVNFEGSRDEKVSIKNILEKILERKNKIGTVSRKQSPYALETARLEKLQKDKEDAALLNNHIKEKYKRERELKIKINELKNDISKIEEKLSAARYFNKKRKLEKAQILKNDIVKIKKEIAEYEAYSDFKEEDIEDAITLKSETAGLKERIKHFENMLYESRKEIEENKSNVLEKKQIEKDMLTYESLEEGKNQISLQNIEETINGTKREIKGAESTKKIFGMLNIFLGPLAVVFVILSISLPMLFIIPAACFLGFILFMLLYLNKKKKINILKNKLIEEESNKENIINRLNDINDKMGMILSKYDAGSKAVLLLSMSENMKNSKNILKHNENIKRLEGNIEKLSEELSKKQRNLNNILCRSEVADIDGLKKALDCKKKYDNLTMGLKTKKIILANTLEGENINDIEEFILKGSKYEKYENKECINLNIENESRKLDETRTLYNQAMQEKAALKKEISMLEERCLPYSENEQDIVKTEEILSKMEEEKDALNLAYEVIEKISSRIRNEFAPQLNKMASQIIKTVTKGRYSNVKITENLNVMAEDPITKMLVDIESLSAGTVDQLYFSLRMSLADIINGTDRLPLFLDDCFAQYDIERLQYILEYLVKNFGQRQIILFTCHRREIGILNNLKAEYTLVDL